MSAEVQQARADEPAAPDQPTAKPDQPTAKRPLYPRLLRLRNVHPNAWQRALLGEGALGVAALLVLADLATAWTLLVLPLAVAAVVKAHDLLAGALGGGSTESTESPDSWQTTAAPVPEGTSAAERTSD